jgi:photosystem II stability/assembly factor-like uncharacterized protein
MADELHGWTVGYHNTFYDSYIYRTEDGGATWQQQFDPSTDLLQGVAALDAQTAIIVGGIEDSYERRTTDGGLSWHSLNVPITSFFFDIYFLNNQTGWMVGGNGDIVKTTDGGNTWVVQTNPAQYSLATIHFSDANNGWAGGYYGTLVRTTNGGATWTLQDPRIPEYTHVLEVHSTSPMRGWIAGYGGGAESRPYVKYTTDGGATWIAHTPEVGPYDSFPALAFVSNEYGWAAGVGGIFRHGALTPTPTPTATPTVTPTPTPAQITLTAQGYLVRGKRAADLSWSGATSNRVDVYRNGALIVTTRNDGFYTDKIGGPPPGTFTYQVCNQGTQTCSNQATVTF